MIDTTLDRSSPDAVSVAVVTGTRADYGLLRTVMQAIAEHEALDLHVVASGMHLVSCGGQPPTLREIEREFAIAATVPMQSDGDIRTGRAADVQALARGIEGFGELFDVLNSDVVLVLGDRIEAFAAAAAASVGGYRVGHMHGGDRAEGVADEAMRHAITKLAHLHFPATAASSDRIIRMGEDPAHVYVVGSPAIDDLDDALPLPDDALAALGIEAEAPFAVVLHHPAGLDDSVEHAMMEAILRALERGEEAIPYVLLAPNYDPGRQAVVQAIGDRVLVTHLPRRTFIGLLRRCAVLVGNSSCGLIEAAALGVPVVNVGPRQHGRERCSNVIDVAGQDAVSDVTIRDAVDRAQQLSGPFGHPYGDGQTGARVAEVLAQLRDHQGSFRKCNTY